MDEKIDIIRLDRSQLSTPEYRELISSLFVSGDVDKRLRYADWVFVENPALAPDEGLPIYVCKVDGKDAGQLAVIPVEIVLAGEHIRGGWCVDFFVSPNFQRRGIGKKLLNAAFNDFPVQMTLGQTDASFELFHSGLKWVFNDNRLTSYKSLLKKRLAFKFLLKKLGIYRGCSPELKPVSFFNLPSGESFDLVNSFADCSDILRGQNVKDKNVAGILRTADFLEWRYLKHPYIKYSINKITLSSGICVHVVWRVVNRDSWCTAVIVDILYSDKVSADSMKHALDIFWQCAVTMGLEVIECQTSDKLVLQGLRDSNMSQRHLAQRFLYGTNSMEKCPIIENDQWRLFAGDCDVETLSF